MPLTEQELARLEALAQAATPGPWKYECYESGTRCVGTGSSDPVRAIYENMMVLCDCCPPSALHWVCAEHDDQERQDLTFIAASREAVPALVAEVRRLNHKLETARTANTAYIADADLYRQAEVARHGRADALEQVARLTAERDAARAEAKKRRNDPVREHAEKYQVENTRFRSLLLDAKDELQKLEAEARRMRPVVEAAVRWLSDLTEYAELELERAARDYRDKEAEDADKG